MSQPKIPINTFNTGWQNIKSWAKQQGLPDTAVNNVYALDQQRISSGSYAMSNAERTRAILAAAGQNYNTALPTDKPSPSDVLGNTVRNVQAIATGLEPTRLVGNIWDTLKTTFDDIKDPSRLNKGSLGADLGAAFTGTALSWVPGVADIGTVLTADPTLSGSAGFKALAENPISSLLDVAPFGKALDLGVGSAVAKSTLGKTLAERTGVAQGALARTGSLRLGGMAVGTIKVGKTQAALRDMFGNPVLDAAGLPRYGVRTLSQRASDRATSLGTGKLLSHVAHAVGETLTQKGHQFDLITRELTDKVSKLTPDTLAKDGSVIHGTHAQFNQIVNSGLLKSDLSMTSPLMKDPSISVEVKDAIQQYGEWVNWHEQVTLAAGDIVKYVHEDGTISLYESSSPVFPKREAADAAQAKLDAAAVKHDQLLDHTIQADQLFAPLGQRIDNIRGQMQGFGNTTQQGIHATQIAMMGRLAGKDGFLDQISQAAKNQDWVALREAAKKARSILTNKSTEDWARVPMLAELGSLLDAARTYATGRAKLETSLDRAYFGVRKTKGEPGKSTSQLASVDTLTKRAQKAHAELAKYVFDHPSGEWANVQKVEFEKAFLASDKAEGLMDLQAAGLKESMQLSPEGQAIIDKMRSQPMKFQELMAAYSDPSYHSPLLPNMTPQDHAIITNTALHNLDLIRATGERPLYVPSLSPRDINKGLLSNRIAFVANKAPTVNAAHAKTMDMSSTVNDVMLGVYKSTKELLQRNAKLETFRSILQPMLSDSTSLRRAVIRDNLRGIEAESTMGPLGSVESLIKNNYHLEPFDIKASTGLDPSEFGLNPDETYYLPREFGKQMDKMFNPKSPNALSGAYDKSTGVFKYSILALSPRYTAHIALGGSMLLILRAHPSAFLYVGKAMKEVNAYHRGEISELDPMVFKGPTAYGSPDQVILSRGGASLAKLNLQEKLVSMGINPKVATVAQFLRAAGDINFRFTNYISDMQRAVAFLDGARHAEGKKTYIDATTGEKVAMTSDRAHQEGMMAVERVMGNLQAMTPLERGVARKIMPFYGWTKHIIKYVLTYPSDHPWRTQFLSTLATQNSENFSSGLDQRMQLLFFIGSPDPSGNITAVDARQMNPFRDVANYATLGGWFSALNPIITGPLETIDPNLTFGGNVLHPNITYNSVYGTNQAGPAGNIVTGLEQEVPEIGALDNAIGLTSQARSIKASGGSAKAIFNALAIPWVPQQLNLQQISAKHEIDRYHQAAADALSAWQTGDFSALMKYPGTVPDPLQAGYNITPAQLATQYANALKQFPGAPPSETVAPLPAPTY